MVEDAKRAKYVGLFQYLEAAVVNWMSGAELKDSGAEGRLVEDV